MAVKQIISLCMRSQCIYLHYFEVSRCNLKVSCCHCGHSIQYTVECFRQN